MAERKVKIFGDLKTSLEGAPRYERGQPVDLRVAEVHDPPKRLTPNEIKRIRLALHASQSRFARLLNVSPNTVESWEQGARKPDSAALKLLEIARKNPQALVA